jgi:hypothetical protein
MQEEVEEELLLLLDVCVCVCVFLCDMMAPAVGYCSWQ